MIMFTELDKHVTIHEQLQEGGGPVVLVNLFTVEPGKAEQLLAAWTDDAAFMKQQPGFISTSFIAASQAVARFSTTRCGKA